MPALSEPSSTSTFFLAAFGLAVFLDLSESWIVFSLASTLSILTSISSPTLTTVEASSTLSSLTSLISTVPST